MNKELSFLKDIMARVGFDSRLHLIWRYHSTQYGVSNESILKYLIETI